MSQYVKFEVREWEQWSDDILKRIEENIKENNITIEELIYAPALNPENPKPFCEHFMFDDVYQNRILVQHHKLDDMFWYINSNDTCLIYKPSLID